MKHRDELGILFTERGYKVAAEIGVQSGVFADIILANWDGTLHMVDCWQHIEQGYKDIANVSDGLHQIHKGRAEAVAAKHNGRGKIIVGLSPEASSLFQDGSLDAVYLDGNHCYEAVMADLAAWSKKIKVGGLICGHDYADGSFPQGEFGVKSAVAEYFGKEPDFITTVDWPSWGVYL